MLNAKRHAEEFFFGWPRHRPLPRPPLCPMLKVDKHKVGKMKKPKAVTLVERLTEAPIIYFDTIPTVSLSKNIVDITLAATLTEMNADVQRKHLVVVADLKLPLATATTLRDLLNKIVLAGQPTPGPSN